MLFFLFGVEEDRTIPIIFPDYTDSLPVLYPYHSGKTKYIFTYGYPDLFSTSFRNRWVGVSLERGKDIDKYVKCSSGLRFNTHSFDFRFYQGVELRRNAFLLKPSLGLSFGWENLISSINISPNIVGYSDTILPNISTENGWDTLSIEYIGNNFLLKPFITSSKNGGIIIQYHHKNMGVRLKLRSENIHNISIRELGYFSPLFYIRMGRDNLVYMDTLSYIPVIYPNFSYIMQNFYIEVGFLLLRVRFGSFNSVDFPGYTKRNGVFTPEFYRIPLKGISFSLNRQSNNIGIFFGRKDTTNIGGLKFNLTKEIHIYRFSISCYAGYFSDTGYYGAGSISFTMKKRFSPVIEIRNISTGRMMGKNFLPLSIYLGLMYEDIQ